MKDPAILQYEAWKDIVQTPGWIYFRELVKEHIEYLDRQTCIAVKNGKPDEAVKHQAKAEDWRKIVDNVDKRIKELKGGIRDGNGR